MTDARLNPWTGEFASADQEEAYRAHRVPELLRHARILCMLSAFLNAGFIIHDFRLINAAAFHVAIGARLAAILVALLCLLALQGAQTYRRIQAILIAGLWLTAIAAAVLVTTGSEIGLVAMLLVPALYYLVVPISFRWTVICGAGCTLLTIGAYLGPSPRMDSLLGFLFAGCTLNVFLMTVVAQYNRYGRLEWAATQAERVARRISAQSQQLLERTFAAVPIPLVITEVESGRLVRCNEAGIRYLGGEPATFGIGSVTSVYLDPADRRAFLTSLAAQGRLTNFETRLRLGNGDLRSVLLAGALAELDGRSCVVSAVVDITERQAAEQQVRHAATHDALTGLINRTAFQALLEDVLRRDGGAVILLLVDLDRLKDVNDAFGHEAGDALLVETARRLRHLAADLGAVARLGGDEFIILLQDQASLTTALDLAEAILRDLRQPVYDGARMLQSRASIGLAVSPAPDYAPGELMKDADLALYAAKNQGRNRVVVYAPAMRRAVTERVMLNRELASANQRGAIVPYYQPKISLLTGHVVGLEALMRWKTDAGAVITPEKFTSAFEDAELAIQVGESILRQIAADARQWLAEGCAFGRIAFNLAPAQFTQPHLASRLLGIVWDADVAPRHFDVEVTETVFLGRDSEHVAPILNALHAAGMRIALDDFGTGYAALTHLKQLPIATVKIDRSFIAHLERDPFDSAIVCAVLELGRTLGMEVVAEGIETLAQARLLRERGCAYAQGFLYGQPMPAEALVAFLKRESPGLAARRVAELSP